MYGYVDQQEYEADQRFLDEYINGDSADDEWCGITGDSCVNNGDCDNCSCNN